MLQRWLACSVCRLQCCCRFCIALHIVFVIITILILVILIIWNRRGPSLRETRLCTDQLPLCLHSCGNIALFGLPLSNFFHKICFVHAQITTLTYLYYTGRSKACMWNEGLFNVVTTQSHEEMKIKQAGTVICVRNTPDSIKEFLFSLFFLSL